MSQGLYMVGLIRILRYTSYAMLSSGISWNKNYATNHLYFPYTHKPLGRVCIRRKYKWQLAYYSTVSHSKALHNCFIPCLNLGKFTGISEKFRNASTPLLQYFYQKKFMKILENLWQSLETFGKLRKQFKSVFWCFYDFLKFSENLRKSSKVFGNFRKTSETVQK